MICEHPWKSIWHVESTVWGFNSLWLSFLYYCCIPLPQKPSDSFNSWCWDGFLFSALICPSDLKLELFLWLQTLPSQLHLIPSSPFVSPLLGKLLTWSSSPWCQTPGPSPSEPALSTPVVHRWVGTLCAPKRALFLVTTRMMMRKTKRAAFLGPLAIGQLMKKCRMRTFKFQVL